MLRWPLVRVQDPVVRDSVMDTYVFERVRELTSRRVRQSQMSGAVPGPGAVNRQTRMDNRYDEDVPHHLADLWCQSRRRFRRMASAMPIRSPGANTFSEHRATELPAGATKCNATLSVSASLVSRPSLALTKDTPWKDIPR